MHGTTASGSHLVGLVNVAPNLLIGLREGLEAGLVVSILVAALVRADRRDRLVPLWLGVMAAAAASLGFGAALTVASDLLGIRGREALAGALSIVAVGFVTWMVLWLKRAARTIRHDLEGRLTSALALGSGALALMGFVAVGREGLETALFLWAAVRSTNGSEAGPLVGAAVGLALAVVLSWLLYRRAIRFDLARFFTVTGAALVVVAGGVLGYGLRDLQEARVLPGLSRLAIRTDALSTSRWWGALLAGVFNVSGRMTWLQVVAAIGYVLVVGWIFLRRRSPRPAPAAPPAPGDRSVAPAAEPAAGDAAQTAPAAQAAPVVPPRRILLATASIAAVGLVAATAVVVASGGTRASAAVEASPGRCAVTGSMKSGASVVQVRNRLSQVLEVYVSGTGADSGVVYGEVENVGPGTTVDMPVSLAPGRYALACRQGVSGDGFGDEFTVADGGAVASPVGYLRTTVDDFVEPLATYRTFVGRELGALAVALAELRARMAAADVEGARHAYVAAHGHYERIGAVYDAFGELDAAINGTADGLPDGERDVAFTGFHRVEAQLWAAPPDVADLAPVGKLAADVDALAETVPTMEIDPIGYVIRAHEILENALQEQVTGLSQRHSRTGIDDTAASVLGARTVLQTLRALIVARDPALLARIDAGLDRVDASLATLARPDGTHLADDRLTSGQRGALTGAIGALLEDLARLPGLIEPRSTT